MKIMETQIHRMFVTCRWNAQFTDSLSKLGRLPITSAGWQQKGGGPHWFTALALSSRDQGVGKVYCPSSHFIYHFWMDLGTYIYLPEHRETQKSYWKFLKWFRPGWPLIIAKLIRWELYIFVTEGTQVPEVKESAPYQPRTRQGWPFTTCTYKMALQIIL
jgi:hypothetical protein